MTTDDFGKAFDELDPADAEVEGHEFRLTRAVRDYTLVATAVVDSVVAETNDVPANRTAVVGIFDVVGVSIGADGAVTLTGDVEVGVGVSC